MGGDMMTATSDLDCLNKCLGVTGALYANYQAAACHDATLGAKSGACYCFSGCTMIDNTCWDLILTSPTGTDPSPAPAPAPVQYEKTAEKPVYCSGGEMHFYSQITWDGDTVADCAAIIKADIIGENIRDGPPCTNFFIHAEKDAYSGVCTCCTAGAPVFAQSGQLGGRAAAYKIDDTVTAASASVVAAGSTTTSTTGVR